MVTFDLPTDVYEALNVPEGEREDVLRRELAVSLYREGIRSIGKARELSGLSRREFYRLHGASKDYRHYTAAELDDDLEYARR
jgi:predicted HTH domain antitoxin